MTRGPVDPKRAPGRRAQATAVAHTDQELQTALWRGYFEGTRKLPLRLGARMRAPDSVLTLLKRKAARVPESLQGIALWNFLRSYTTNAAPIDDLNELLGRILRIDLPEARRIRRERPDDVLPPYPKPLILDTVWQLQDDWGVTTAKLEICLQRRFRELRDVANPRSWSRCALFWPRIEGRLPATLPASGAWSGKVEARLNLPGETDEQPLAVTLQAGISAGPLEVETWFEFEPNDRIEVCRGYVSVRKEPGRPDATRIIQERLVRFAPGTLQRLRRATLAYWLQAETVCLALPDPLRHAPGGLG